MRTLREQFNPRTIALIGASEREGTVGRDVLENLLHSKDRKIFPINPNKQTVMDVPCYPNIGSAPGPVDMAVIATPADTVPQLVEECGRACVDVAIILSAGFREAGEEGKRLEADISEIGNTYGMRIVGPNCVGVIMPHIGLNTTFLKTNPPPGNIAFISQSGALGSAILDWAVSMGIGFSLFASLGSMIDVDFGDMIDLLGQDDNTRSIMIYMEGIGNARKFMSAARGFARTKPIIIVKPGRFGESAKAALSHTGSMAGDDAVYEAAFKRVGVVRVKEIADLFNAAKVLDSRKLPNGPRLAVITNAGGPGVMTTDALVELGGELSTFSDARIEELNTFLPPHWSKGNPVDVLGDADIDRYTKAIEACVKDEGVDGVLVIFTPQGAAHPARLAEAVSSIAKRAWKPIVTSWMGGERVREAREVFIRNDVPAYETPEEAAKTYAHMWRYKKNLDLLYETPAEVPVDQAPPKNNLKALIRRAAREGRTVLTEEESKSFLETYGIPVTTAHVAYDLQTALTRAQRIGFPVVLKVRSPDIIHKSDVGGVITGIGSAEAFEEAYGNLMHRVTTNAPRAAIEGVTVQKMLQGIDYETILGTKKDRDFGSVILFGMGGISTEILRDFSVGLPPLNQTLARRLMEETKVYEMLQGYRQRPPADLRRLEGIIVSFSNLIVDFPEIAELDINPLAIANGQPCALDARVVIDIGALDDTSRLPHLVISPYPTKYVMPWTLPDGTTVLLRPIRPEDEPLEHELLSGLSEETMRTRFFSPIKEITHEMLVRFCNIDYEREMAIVAEIREGQKRKIVGIGRLIAEPPFDAAEFAVLVHDDYQGKGLGYKLVDVLIGIAHDKDLEKMYGTVLSENEKMLAVCRKLGFQAKRLPDGISEVVLELR